MGTPGGGCRGLGVVACRPTFRNPRARVLGQVLQRGGGSGHTALTSEHYARPPLCCQDSVRRRPPPSVPSPAAWGRHFPSQTLVEPSWSQAGISPLGSPCRPTLCRPQNLGFSVYFLIRMPAMREPPGGPSVGVGALGRVLSTLFCPHLHRGGRASQGRRVPQSRHYGSLTIRMWHFFVVVYKLHRLPLAHTPTPPASSPLIPRRQEHIYFWSEKIILPEKGKSWRRF